MAMCELGHMQCLGNEACWVLEAGSADNTTFVRTRLTQRQNDVYEMQASRQTESSVSSHSAGDVKGTVTSAAGACEKMLPRQLSTALAMESPTVESITPVEDRQETTAARPGAKKRARKVATPSPEMATATAAAPTSVFFL